ncbi:hypothetical protein AX15_007794 [Amanita polypyramis BW_CC]|nr:hypothetical protein AX15_007794 [Amanita polypyramis BW_CC]
MLLFCVDWMIGNVCHSSFDPVQKSHSAESAAAVALSERTQLQVVGGSFALTGVSSPAQHRALVPILRASIYLHLALILDQHVLSDSNVRLKYPRPKYESHAPSESESVQTINDAITKSRRRSGLRSTLLNLFSKRAYSNRSSTIASVNEYPSLELSRNHSVQFPRKGGGEISPRSSLDSLGQRIRRFSIRGSDVHARPKKPREDPNRPFFSTVCRIENGKDLLSTSFDVSFHPPEVLLNLSQQEEKDPARNLRGKERCALTTLLGWDSDDGNGKEMTGLAGFVHHQCLSILVSRHVPQPATVSTHGGDEQLVKPARLTCGRPRRKTFWYYAKGRRRDPTLGEVIINFSTMFPLACEEPGCTYKCGEHQLKFMHDKARIDIAFSGRDREQQGDENGSGKIMMWETCAVCGAKSAMKEMCDGTYLLSFAKYLELLIYSFAIHSSPICEHTTPGTDSQSDASKFAIRFNFVRHFATDTCDVAFSLSEEQDIFELHLPRLQMYGSGERASHPMCPDNCQDRKSQLEEAQTVLRRQIKSFFETVSDYLDKIEELLAGPDSDMIKKTLPRLPSATDESYENIPPFEPVQTSTVSTYLTTTTDTAYSSLLNSNMMDPVVVRVSREDNASAMQLVETDPLRLLLAMRYSFQRAEQLLYAQLSQTPAASLNDVRRSFLVAGRGVQKRTVAWKKKHFQQQQLELAGDLNAPEPVWWGKTCHALPGGSVLVNEDDRGSIIAFTLSSLDYQQELSGVLLNRSSSGTNALNIGSVSEIAPPSQPPTPSAGSAVTIKGYKFFSNSSQPQQPDPDKEDVVWHEPEVCATVVTRKEVSRDSASILSIRDMLRSRTLAEPSGSSYGTPTLKTMALGSGLSSTPILPCALPKPDVQVNKEAAGGQVAGLPDGADAAGNMLQELQATASVESLKLEFPKEYAESVSPASTLGRKRMRESPASASSSFSNMRFLPPDVPPKEKVDYVYPGSTRESPPATPGRTASQSQDQGRGWGNGNTPSLFANTLTNSLSYALRLMSSGQSTPRGNSSQTAKMHHGLLLTDDGYTIDEKPHIKYEAMVGKRLKLSCVVYYARQFDLLRKRCGVDDDVFVKSLSRSSNWAAEGGKSKANFWKTDDDRFVIKTLVNAWNVADL